MTRAEGMNLEQSIIVIQKQITELKKKDNIEPNQIRTYKKVECWLDELLRYRLFLSEFRREIELSDCNSFDSQYLLNLIDEEIKEWRLYETIE